MREQGVWGEATHTRETCACARLLKSGNEGYSKENRQNVTNMTIYQSGNEGYSKENRQNVTNMTIYQIWQFDHILQSKGFEGVS